MKKHPKKTALFAAIGVLLPFSPAFSDEDVASVANGPSDPTFWAAFFKLLAFVLGPAATMLVGGLLAGGGAFAIAAGKTLVGFGKAKLEDKDPSNDFVGQLETALGNGVVAFGEKLSPPDRTPLQLAPPPPDSNSFNTPKTGT